MDNTNTVSKSAKGKNYLVVGLRHRNAYAQYATGYGNSARRSIELVQESPLGDPIIMRSIIRAGQYETRFGNN